MKLKLIFLGTGTSQGVPVIGCKCKVCGSLDKKDKRLRASILVHIDNHNILIDIGPDFRYQMLRINHSLVDAILLTHQHRDHTAGLDDIRPIYFSKQKNISIYAEDIVLNAIQRDYQYLFNNHNYPGKPNFNLLSIDNKPFDLSGIQLNPIRVMHYKLPIFGYRIGDLTYITDANYISASEKKKIMGSKILIINSLQKESHISHYNLEESLSLIQEVNPERAYLTHIGHNMGLHHEVSKELPKNVFLAYDNLELNI